MPRRSLSEESSADSFEESEDEDEEDSPKRQRKANGGAARKFRSAAAQPTVAVQLADSAVAFELFKDGKVIARLYDGAPFGNFTAYSKMVVTDEGSRKGLRTCESGTFVQSPWAKTQNKVAIQMPPRSGILHRIVIGSTSTGSTKVKPQQQRLLYLC